MVCGSGFKVSLGHDPLRFSGLVLCRFGAISHSLFMITKLIPNIALEFICLLLVTDVFIEFDVG